MTACDIGVYNAIKQQKQPEAMIHLEERALREDGLQILYIVLTNKSLRQWTTDGTMPPQAYYNGADDRRGNYNIHKRVERAIKDFINVYLNNSPENYPQHFFPYMQCRRVGQPQRSNLDPWTTIPQKRSPLDSDTYDSTQSTII
eukprot:6456528-Amphidinium_carterae.1